MIEMKVAFIGSGNMGEAMISALLSGGTASTDAIRACDIDEGRRTAIESKHRVTCTADAGAAIEGCDVVVLSIKPQKLPDVLKQLKGALKPDQVVVSIMAGVKLDTIVQGLGHDRVVRVMPNTPAQVGEGMSVWTATAAVTESDQEAARTILQAMGREVYFADEKFIDMATAISGSGPAYVFLVMEALADAAVHIGLPRDTAQELVTQTVLGSARLVRESGRHPAELKNAVTSPGGTTAEGLLCLEEGGVRAIVAQAVIAAYEKAKALGSGGK
jgi:pyrroline-5-carboxylate reductase